MDSLKLALALANEYNLDPTAEMDYTQVETVREIAEYVHAQVNARGEL